MQGFGDRINELCKRDGVTLAAACDQAGVTYKTLHAQIRNDRAIPFETVDRLARHFNVPMDYFSAFRPTMAIQPQADTSLLHQRAAAAYTAALRSEQIAMMRAGHEISTDDVLNWIAAQNNTLTNFDALSERVDLFETVSPEDKMMKPHRIGKESLATQFFKLENEDHYRRTVQSFDPKFIDEILLAHYQASKVKYSISDQDIDVRIGADRIVQSYRRIIAPVTDLNGKQYLLVHAKLI